MLFHKNVSDFAKFFISFQLFCDDLKEFLTTKYPSKIHYTHINEINNKVLVRGDYVGEVVEFLKEKGF